MKRNLHAGMELNGGLSLKVLTDDEINEIHLGTLEILDQTGVFIEDEKALDRFEWFEFLPIWWKKPFARLLPR